MSNHGNMEESCNRNASENVEGEVPEPQTLIKEAVNEQIRGFIAPLTHQLEELTQLVPGMTTSGHPNSYPRTELSTTSGKAMPQSDTFLPTQLLAKSSVVAIQNFNAKEILISASFMEYGDKLPRSGPRNIIRILNFLLFWCPKIIVRLC